MHVVQQLIVNLWRASEVVMSLARIIGSSAVLCGTLWFLAGAVAAADIKEEIHGEIQRAEKEIAHAGQNDQANPASDPLSVDPDLAVWTFIVFAVLLMVLWKFAWGPIVAGLEKREESIAHNIAAAQQQHDEAKQLLADYEVKLAGAADQVRAMLDEARRDAEQTKQSIIAEAKSGAESERLRGLRDIETATDAALQTLAERSAQLAVELAGKIVHNSLNAKDHSKLIQEAVAKFPTASKN
jgi:F-type H+-transporting ATPase subunit b